MRVGRGDLIFRRSFFENRGAQRIECLKEILTLAGFEKCLQNLPAFGS